MQNSPSDEGSGVGMGTTLVALVRALGFAAIKANKTRIVDLDFALVTKHSLDRSCSSPRWHRQSLSG
jgi:hypothetical protein